MESQKGAVKLSVVVAAVLGFGFSASAFLNISQHQRAEQERKLMQGEIVDLRYQVQQDKLASDHPSPSPSPSPDSLADIPSDSPTPSPGATPAVLGDSATPAPTPPPATKVLTEDANLRATASKTSDLKARVHKNDVATIIGDPSGSYQQVTINGMTGYVLTSVLK
jgi:hypothetical protein